MKYRKKPIVVEAVQYLGEDQSQRFSEVPDWLFNAIYENEIYYDGQLYIETLEGNHEVSEGDYIIKGVKDELYACKPEIFEMTYKEVEEEK